MISSAVAFSVGSKAPVVLCDFTEKLVGLRSQFFHLGGSYRIVVVIQPASPQSIKSPHTQPARKV